MARINRTSLFSFMSFVNNDFLAHLNRMQNIYKICKLAVITYIKFNGLNIADLDSPDSSVDQTIYQFTY